MDTTSRLLRHMRWANQQVYSAVAALPDEALAAYIVNPDWPAAQILQHIVRAARRYQSIFWPGEGGDDFPLPTSMQDVRELAAVLDAADARLIDAAELPDGPVERRMPSGEVQTAMRVTVLAQAVHHSNEHRAQLVDALNSRGHHPISLDDLSLWNFEGVDR